MMDTYTIVRNDERYTGLGQQYPRRMECYGTLEQVKLLAEDMCTLRDAGCDKLFYVEGHDD